MIRLRGKWVQVDPKYWDADMDVQVNVALGHGTDNDKMQFLMMVAQKQEQIMQTLGPSNPIVDAGQYRNTLAQICTLAGFKDASRYFKPVDMQVVQQMMQQAAQNQPPDPNMELVKIEAMKTQAKAQNDAFKLQLDAQDAARKNELDQQKMHLDAMVRIADIEAKYGTQVNIAHLEAMIGHDQELVKAQIGADAAKHGQLVQALATPTGQPNV
jgi:hypothetical protein